MNEVIDWQGYLAMFDQEALMIQSPYIHDDAIVFGADSDYTTMAIAGLHLLASKGIGITNVRSLPLVNPSAVKSATGTTIMCDDEDAEPCEWNLLVGEEATLVFTNNLERNLGFHGPAELESMDPTFYADIQTAWEQEMKPTHVSQGAYVSEAAYMEGANARLGFMAQSTKANLIWPPRQLDAEGQRIESPSQPLMASATVESWTKL
ncbi:MAG: hypothetical protein P8Q85_05460, partial [Candidatus Poseidoniaceae archaeon]|nr:hypothetical protein [Candidatus Poseidoniaceae archaeon]